MINVFLSFSAVSSYRDNNNNSSSNNSNISAMHMPDHKSTINNDTLNHGMFY